MKRWYTGSGHSTTIENIHNTIKQYSKKNGKVYIGSDSFIQKKLCLFAQFFTILCSG